MTPRRRSATLPKALVKRLGAGTVRELIGLSRDTGSGVKQIRAVKTQKVKDWVKTTKLNKFSSAQAARYCGINPREAAAILHCSGLVTSEYFTKDHRAVWEKVPA